MNSELTNLLPDDRARALRRDYFFRLASVTFWMGAILVAVTGILLIPTSVFLNGEIGQRNAKLASLESTLASSDEVALEARLSALNADTAALAALGGVTSPSTVLKDTLAVPRPGIVLTGFSFTATQTGKSGQLLINGTASSRDDLRAYQLALQGASFVKNADLPISAYANDTNIPFIITVTLSPNI